MQQVVHFRLFVRLTISDMWLMTLLGIVEIVRNLLHFHPDINRITETKDRIDTFWPFSPMNKPLLPVPYEWRLYWTKLRRYGSLMRWLLLSISNIKLNL